MKNKIKQEGLTYDDVLVIPEYSNILPNEVLTNTRFSRKVGRQEFIQESRYPTFL